MSITSSNGLVALGNTKAVAEREALAYAKRQWPNYAARESIGASTVDFKLWVIGDRSYWWVRIEEWAVLDV